MIKELAISLLNSNRVYLMSEGKRMLREVIIPQKRLRKENEKPEIVIVEC